MFAWLSSWFYTSNVIAPARNMPEGVNVSEMKKIIETKPIEIGIITENDIVNAKKKLTHVERQPTPPTYTSPLMAEFNSVFEMGYKNYFERKKSKSDIK